VALRVRRGGRGRVAVDSNSSSSSGSSPVTVVTSPMATAPHSPPRTDGLRLFAGEVFSALVEAGQRLRLEVFPDSFDGLLGGVRALGDCALRCPHNFALQPLIAFRAISVASSRARAKTSTRTGPPRCEADRGDDTHVERGESCPIEPVGPRRSKCRRHPGARTRATGPARTHNRHSRATRRASRTGRSLSTVDPQRRLPQGCRVLVSPTRNRAGEKETMSPRSQRGSVTCRQIGLG
jgi:hypothetical protein